MSKKSKPDNAIKQDYSIEQRRKCLAGHFALSNVASAHRMHNVVVYIQMFLEVIQDIYKDDDVGYLLLVLDGEARKVWMSAG